MRFFSRTLFVTAMLGFALTAMGARCIENVAVRKDDAGNTYLLGEIYNDTDVQGVGLTLRATLYDDAHNVIASKDTLMCPANLQPHGITGYAVKFDEQNLNYSSFDVRPTAGKTLDQPLPVPQLQVEKVAAEFVTSGTDQHGVNVTLLVRNTGASAYASPQLCLVAYDTSGKVRSFSPIDPKLFHADTALSPGKTTDLSVSLRGQVDAVRLRVWVWFPDSPTASLYQPLMTDALPIAP